jgi:hypothetical protein
MNQRFSAIAGERQRILCPTKLDGDGCSSTGVSSTEAKRSLGRCVTCYFSAPLDTFVLGGFRQIGACSGGGTPGEKGMGTETNQRHGKWVFNGPMPKVQE